MLFYSKNISLQETKDIMNMKNIISIGILLLFLTGLFSTAQAKHETDCSLYLKKNPAVQLDEVSSEKGDLYHTVGHHGPAVENDYFALRLYFSKKVAIDAYNKQKPGMELKKYEWYPKPEEQKKNAGADYYKVSNTVGLGSVKLWDGEKIVFLDPVSKRTARVKKGPDCSYMEMLSEGVSYKGHKVDILIRVTAYNSLREAKVEAFALSGEPVQFITGINYHKTTHLVTEKNYIYTWGIHPEDVASEQINIGAAIIFNPEEYVKRIDTGNQSMLITKPTKYTSHWVTTACEKEKKLNTETKFKNYVELAAGKLIKPVKSAALK